MKNIIRNTLITLTAAFGLAFALPPLVVYDQPISFSTGDAGNSLTAILESLAEITNATLLMHDIPDVNIKYSVPTPRPMREVWSLLVTIHGLDYFMHDDATIVVAPRATLDRFVSRVPRVSSVDVFYREIVDLAVTERLVSERYQASTLSFPDRNLLLVSAAPGTHRQIEAFIIGLNDNLRQSPRLGDVVAEDVAVVDVAVERGVEPAAPVVEEFVVTRVGFYDFGPYAEGLAGLIVALHPDAVVRRVGESVVSVDAVEETHSKIVGYMVGYGNPISLLGPEPVVPVGERAFMLVNQDVESATVELLAALGEAASRVTVTSLVRNNGIVVRGDASVVEDASRLLRVIDQRLPQLLLTMKVTELSEREAESLGINLAASVGTFAVSVLESGLGLIANPFDGLRRLDLEGTLQMLERQNLARTLSEVTLRSTHNRPASFKSGGSVRIEVADQLLTVDFGTMLTVKPLISPDGLITLDVTANLSDFVGTLTSVSGLQLSERELRSTVSFREGDTVVLGGMLRNGVTVTESGVPFLMNLPVIGRLFSTRTAQDERSDYVVVIRGVLVE
jgi:type II secretory pathway component GspD/PulD (secretin)